MIDASKYEKLVEGRLDYKTDPSLLDIAQETRNERLLFERSIEIAKNVFPHNQPITVLDLCSGSGLFTKHILNSLNVLKAVCVDNDRKFVVKSKQNLSFYNADITYFCQDATYFKAPEKFDLILLGSAYHHIEDRLKVKFLKNAKSNLKEDGFILVNENFLPEYKEGNIESYKESVYIFYNELFIWLKSNNTPDSVINILRQTAWFGFQREYELKVSYELFMKSIKDSKLKMVSEERVWPLVKNNKLSFGSYILLLKKD